MPARHHESQIILGNGEKLKFLQSKLKVTSEEISLESLLMISDLVSPPPIWLQYSKQLESRSIVAQQVYIKLQTAEESTWQVKAKIFLRASGLAGRLLAPHPASSSSLNISYLLPNDRLDINSNTTTNLDHICLGRG